MIQYMIFGDWLLSFIMFFKVQPFVVYITTSFLFVAKDYAIVRIDNIFSFISGWVLGWF